MCVQLSRRDWLAAAPAALGLAAAGSATATATATTATLGRPPDRPFLYCLNTSTISGQKLPIDQVVAIADKAGYDAIEPWIREIEAYKEAGRSLDDLRKRIIDAGLSVESSIGFAEWGVDDEGRRGKGLERMKRDMDLVRSIGGKRIAAPPVGLTDVAGVDLRALGERYRAVCDIGDSLGVVPQAEVWGFSKTMGRLSEVVAIVIEAAHPRACLLPDVYHLHKGGSNIEGLRLLGPAALHAFHMNDYPADPPRATITDAARVYPGDGVAPLTPLIRTLREIGFRGALSLEVFNRDYWKRDAAEVAAIGLAKMKAAVDAALAPA